MHSRYLLTPKWGQFSVRDWVSVYDTLFIAGSHVYQVHHVHLDPQKSSRLFLLWDLGFHTKVGYRFSNHCYFDGEHKQCRQCMGFLFGALLFSDRAI